MNIKQTFSVIMMAVGISVASMSVSAQTPSDASINKLMKVMHAKEMSQKMIQQAAQPIADSMQSLPEMLGAQLTAEQTQELKGIMSEFMQQTMSELASDDAIDTMMQHFSEASKAHYTQAEVDGMIAFYGSNVGQSVIQKQPLVMQTYMKTIQPFMQQQNSSMMKNAMPSLMKKMKAFTAKHGLEK